ncbi:YdeI/OmpD-associated family protein [Iamia majanohamensis]|uniref:YdeI/OmpD-associated family protein n=1 Tax=Iamia majanohamensis TaxID=467976 RepID=A0AAE9YDH0_9ACTN|nr:YdeI/OmpD-associated family protein [Iamia majanohamensis]WCO65801.1 YdeI/OmpD-associated family protein [Iamia majanohamensis]
MAHDDAERFEPASLAEWTEWLEAHHDRDEGVWLVTSKKATGRQALTYEQAVVEALRVGWVDSVRRRIDDQRSRLWFTRRRPGSPWSAANRERIAALEAEGRLLAAGAAAVAAAREDGSWEALAAVEALEVPGDLAGAFARHPGSREAWDAFPPSARKAILDWIRQAKRDATREKRLEETAAKAAVGERANEWVRR